ncbi:hypothetical protein EDF73_111104 [Raoultella sp. BIGb0138]|uniref:hypothetical protein n=1 Tax=Raoultella sp. BIGb0138 TaxID=2485115 RepID=UPI0010526B9C|nr:hypothetical protein [Raoultella sp. BIGb0138]TCW08581.1 hypothetical protein EDF73_111104 [Raoultella sp. BIGb0138]
MKIYEYQNLLVQVPAGVSHLMIGADGVLRGYRTRPDTSLSRPWESGESIIPAVLNWEKSLSEIAALREYSPIIIHEFAPPGTERFRAGDKYTLHAAINEELCLTSEVHAVVSCYTPGMKPWCQILKLKVEGLSIDNILLANVKEVLHDLKVTD